MVEDDVARLGDVAVLVVYVAIPEVALPVVAVAVMGHHFLIDAGLDQAVADEHRAPFVIGRAVPAAVVAPALNGVAAPEDEVFGAFPVAQLGICHSQQLVGEGHVVLQQGQGRGLVRFVAGRDDVGLGLHGFADGVGHGDGQLVVAVADGVAGHLIKHFLRGEDLLALVLDDGVHGIGLAAAQDLDGVFQLLAALLGIARGLYLDAQRGFANDHGAAVRSGFVAGGGVDGHRIYAAALGLPFE